MLLVSLAAPIVYTMTDATLGLPNPIMREFWTRPQEEIHEELDFLRERGPVFVPEPYVPPEIPLPQGPGTWVVTSVEDILHISKNPQIFSSAKGITVMDQPPEFVEYFSSMIAMDDPRHAQLRRIVSAGFTPRALARLDSSVQQVAHDIVASIKDKDEIDFVVDVAAALPLKIVCDLMGVPDSEYRFVFDRTNVILGASDPEYVPEGTDVITAILTAGAELGELMKQVAEAKKGGDGTDLTSMLMNAELPDDRLSEADLASFFVLLVVAGNETTRNAISWGLHLLSKHPDQRELWRSDFEGRSQGAVEEIVRYASPVTYMRRTLTQDAEVSGVEMKAGEKVCMFYLAANRDPKVFDDPHAFNILRSPNPHVGFGGPGPHFCLGAHLARREITVMFRELFQQVPNLIATGEPDLLASSFIHGIKHLKASPQG